MVAVSLDRIPAISAGLKIEWWAPHESPSPIKDSPMLSPEYESAHAYGCQLMSCSDEKLENDKFDMHFQNLFDMNEMFFDRVIPSNSNIA